MSTIVYHLENFAVDNLFMPYATVIEPKYDDMSSQKKAQYREQIASDIEGWLDKICKEKKVFVLIFTRLALCDYEFYRYLNPNLKFIRKINQIIANIRSSASEYMPKSINVIDRRSFYYQAAEKVFDEVKHGIETEILKTETLCADYMVSDDEYDLCVKNPEYEEYIHRQLCNSIGEHLYSITNLHIDDVVNPLLFKDKVKKYSVHVKIVRDGAEG